MADPMRRLIVRVAKEMSMLPRDIEVLGHDEFFELVAEFSVESDELAASRESR